MESATAPVEPIIVLGKANMFFYPVPTVALAVEYTDRYVSNAGKGGHNPDMPQTGRFTLDELDFYDARGRTLTPVLEAGSLVDLVVEADPRPAIRARISTVLADARSAAAALDEPGVAGRIPATPGGTFEEFLDSLVRDPNLRFDQDEHCNWIARVFGLCR